MRPSYRLLLIDHNSQHLGQLEAICARGFQLKVAPIGDVVDALANADSYDGLIVAGSYSSDTATVSDNDPQAWQTLLENIRDAERPVLGLGWGFELVCAAFGVALDQLGEQSAGEEVMTPTEAGAVVFQGSDPIKVQPIVRWQVEAEDLPKVLQALAISDGSVEAVRHKKLPVFGLQLFPEEFVYPSDGKLVVENILDIMRKADNRNRPKQ